MRRPLVFALALGAGALGTPAVAPAAPPPPPASLLTGTLCDTSGACSTTTPIALHRHLRAGDQGATLRLANGITLRCDPGTSFWLSPAVPVPTAPGVALRAAVITLHAGRVVVRGADRRDPSALIFRGPRSTSALVRTGEATLRANEDGLFLSVVMSPGAMIAAGNDWSECPEGSVCSAPGKHDSVKRLPTIDAPLPTVSTLAAASVDGKAITPTLRWHATPNADHYEVRVTRSPNIADVRSSLETRTTEAPLAALNEPGTYWATLRAFDLDGLPGRWSRFVRVRVAHIETPRGAFVSAAGDIFLPTGSSLRLHGVEGMRIGTEGVRDEFAAPAEIGLGRGTARPLRLREPGGDEGVPLHLAPRNLRVSVDIGPKTAHWPEDRVTIKVRLADAEGHPLPESIPFHVEATLDLQPLSLHWEREGDTLSAVVPPRPLQTHAVIRVEVNDDHGLSLGRSSLEILPAARVVLVSQARR
ncbi:MAG: hypothetical protein MUF34_03980 [Polyangiaceae bacterium]|nr:hypothetical protein [Polyangiaceae bacterium]